MKPVGGNYQAAMVLSVGIRPAASSANTDGSYVIDVRQLPTTPDWAAVSVQYSLIIVGVVQVSVKVDNVQRSESAQAAYHRVSDGMGLLATKIPKTT